MRSAFPFLAEPQPWGPKPQPTLVAVHLLLCALADNQGEVVDAVPRLAAILGVEARTIYTHVGALIEGGRMLGPPGRPRVPVAPPDRSPDRFGGPGSIPVIVGSKIDPTITKIDPTINFSDPRINSAAPVAALTTAKRSEAPLASLVAGVERVLDRASRYVPSDKDGHPLSGRAIRIDCADTRQCVALLLTRETERAGGLAEAVAKVVRYVEGFAALCERDPSQRRYYSPRMFSLVVTRRKAPWDVVTSAVDLEQLPRASAHVDGACTPGRYGGGKVEL